MLIQTLTLTATTPTPTPTPTTTTTTTHEDEHEGPVSRNPASWSGGPGYHDQVTGHCRLPAD
jgi:hypothetical protein